MLKNCYRSLPYFFCCFLLYIEAKGQNILQSRLDSFTGKLITAIRLQAKPRAVLTTDKSVFNAGETIWFNTFLLNTVSGRVHTKTKYLFVDLVNEDDNVITSVLLDPERQQLSGKIVLPYNIPPGYYWLRAYTRQMARSDSGNCAVRSIYIFNANLNTDIVKPAIKTVFNKQGNSPMIDFYPEGGSLITGANSTVAFSVHDNLEKPIAAEGVIKDNLDAVVTRFTAGQDGLGKFTFSPSRYRQYKAYITWNGKEAGYPLPHFNFNAGQLSVANQAGGQRLVRVLLEDSIYSADFVTYIIGISRDSLCFAGIGRGQYEITVPDQKFPGGIATFYLFDNNFTLLSERSIFVRENNAVVKAAVNKESYGKKDKVTLNISVADKDSRPVSSLFSVAVTDSLFSDPPDVCGILPVNEANRQKMIDNLLMSRMRCAGDDETDLIMLLKNKTLPDINNNLVKSGFPADLDSLLHIRGTALSEKNEPAAGKLVTLISKSGNGIYVTDTTDDSGRFYFPVEGYHDSTEFSLAVNGPGGNSQRIHLVIDPPDLPHFKTPASLKQYSPPSALLAKYRKAYINEEFAGPDKERLPAITVVSKKAANYDVSKRVSQNSAIITSEDIPEGMSIGNALLGVSGLHMINGVLIINGPTQMAAPDAGSEPMILVDAVQVPLSTELNSSPAMSFLNSLSIKDIDFIEVLKGADGANYGLRGGNGVILINMSHTHKDKFLNSGNNISNFYAKGISNPAIFPAINYHKTEGAPAAHDIRSTIFWEGSVLAGSADDASFGFFTSDVTATYKITISGITVHGDIIYKTLTFQTK